MSDNLVREPWCGACLMGVLGPDVDYASAGPAPMHISPDTNFLVEKRFMKRMARRTKPAESGCPVRRRKLLPVLNWHRQRQEVNWELHAMNGNTSSSVAAQSESTIDSHVGPVLLPVQRPVSVGSEYVVGTRANCGDM